MNSRLVKSALLESDYTVCQKSKSVLILKGASLVALFLFLTVSAIAQSTIYSTDFGTTSGTFLSGWTASGGSTQHSASQTSASSGYSGASGSNNASNGTNGTATLVYNNSLSTVGYTNITVQWGGRMTSTGASPVFYWSSNGTTWNSVSFIDVSNNSTWALISAITLPSGAEGVSNLQFKWVSGSNANTYRMDDFKVQGCAAPTTQASAITFSSVGSSSMTINWTNGDGGNRVVKMNSSNSFTAPSDGTSPSASTTWANSGEQVVYNSSSNSVTVTGLSSSTTYWYRVYESNCTGANTKYITSTATNNPNSQATIATSAATDYFRSKQTGNWDNTSTWESSSDNSTWINATVYPKYTANTVTIQSGHDVTITVTDTIDQVVVTGKLIYGNYSGATPYINNGSGVDLTINGTFEDIGPHSIGWATGAKWSLGSSGTILRTRGTSAVNWRDNYDGGISTIPATANWIIRKTSSDSPLLSSTSNMYYPNLTIENNYTSAWTTGTNSSFTGSSTRPIVKGNLNIGGSGSNTVSFLNENTNASTVLVNGNLIVQSGSTLRHQGTGFEVQGDFTISGTLDNSVDNAALILSGSNNQNVSGTGLTIKNLTLNKTSTSYTVTLQNAVALSGTLTLTQGYLITTSTNLLTINSGASVSGTNDNAFVSGPVKKIGDESFIFPIGKTNKYIPLAISKPSSSTDAFTAEYFDYGQAYADSVDTTVTYINDCEFFTLTRNNGSSNVKVTLSINQNNSCLNQIYAPHIIEWNGSNWVDNGIGEFEYDISTLSVFSGNVITNYIALAIGSIGEVEPDETACGDDDARTTQSVNCSDITNYIPAASSPITTFKLNFHFFKRSSGSGPYDNITYADAQTLVGYLNWVQASNEQPTLPTNPAAAYIVDSKVRYKLAGVYFHTDDHAFITGGTTTDLCDYNNYFHGTYSVNSTSEINIFYVSFGNYPGNGCGPTPYVVMSGTSSNIINGFGLLGHELGHSVGGHYHTNSSSYIVPDVDDYTKEVGYPWGWINCTQGTISNNMMGYNKCQHYLSPKQVANFHRRGNTSTLTGYTTFCDYKSANSVTVTSSDTWTRSRAIGGDLIIKSGVTLTVNCSVFLPEKGRVIVEAGAHLIIDGGTFTNGCGKLWRGIQVQGHSTLNQTTSGNQGKLTVINGSILEHMFFGVTTIKYTIQSDGEVNYDDNATGGILLIDGVIFRNNVTDIRIYPYRYNTVGYSGYIQNSYFLTTQTLRSNQSPSSHIKIDGINAYTGISNNQFIYNASLSYSLSNRGTGIEVTDSKPYIYSNSTDTANGNIFKNLYQGVKVSGSVSNLYNPVISFNTFVNCYRGGLISNTTAFKFVDNIVGTQDVTNAYGLFVDGCTSYIIERNAFTSAGNTTQNTGVIINNSGTGDNWFYRNSLNNYYVGSNAQNQNQGNSGATGLKINCNIYNGIDYNIFVSGTNSNTGIHNSQGSDPVSNQEFYLARNQFNSYPTCSDENLFKVEKISGGSEVALPYNIEYKTNSDANTLISSSCKDNVVQAAQGSNNVNINYSTHCLVDYHNEYVCPGCQRLAFHSNKKKIKEIELSASNYNPKRYLGKKKVNLNEDALQKNTEYVQRTAMQEGLVNEIIKGWLNDSTLINPYDSIIDLLSDQVGINYRKIVIEAYKAKNDFASASSKINTCSADPLYVQYNEALLDIVATEESVSRLDSSDAIFETLTSLTDSGCLGAVSLIEGATGMYLEREIFYPTSSESSQRISNKHNSMKSINEVSKESMEINGSATNQNLAKVVPNPNNGNFFIEFERAIETVGIIEILNVEGRILETIKIEKNQRVIEYRNQNLSKGFYYIITKDYANNIISKNKIIID